MPRCDIRVNSLDLNQDAVMCGGPDFQETYLATQVLAVSERKEGLKKLTVTARPKILHSGRKARNLR